MNDNHVIVRRIGLPLLAIVILVGLIATGLHAGPPRETRDFNTIGSQLEDAKIILDPLWAEDELVVRMNDLDSAAIDDINGVFGTSVKQYLPRLGVFLLNAPTGSDLQQLAADIANLDGVMYVHTNYLTIPMQGVQGSFAFSDENNVGTYPDQTVEQMLDLAAAHAYATGYGVKIAIIDGGVDYTHPALDGMVEWGWDYVDDDASPFDEPGGDNSGHGTFIAGVLHQVAPDATLRAYRVSQVDGSAHGYLVAEAIMQAVYDGCQVISLSLVVTGEHKAIAEALSYARSHNVVVVAAAGNGSTDEPLYPASDPNVIAVAAVDQYGALADFSRFGAHVDVSAPGVDIYSSYQNDYFAWWSGTSFAAPYVAGQAALLVSRRVNSYDANWISDLIVSTATNLSLKNPGLDGVLGGGLIDPVASLQADTADVGVAITQDYMELIYGVLDTAVYGVFISATNSPTPFEIEFVDDPEFMSFEYMSGVADAWVYNYWDASELEPGTYQDTVLFHIDGVYNDPITKVFTLRVVLPVDTAWAWVEYTGCDRFIYVDTNQWCCEDTFFFEIKSDNAPAAFTVSKREYGDPKWDFMTLLTSEGTTPGRVYFTVDNTSVLANFEGRPGCPTCSIQIENYFNYEVEGVLGYEKPGYGSIVMTVRPGYDPSVTTLSVNPNPIPVTVIADGPPVETCFIVETSGSSDTAFTIIPYDLPDYITFDSWTGYTGTSSCFTVDPATMDPGEYQLFYRVSAPLITSIIFEVDITVVDMDSTSADPNNLNIALSCHPNPFNPTTEIQFTLPQNGFVKLSIFNTLGQEVRQLVNGELGAGEHTVTWDSRASSGQQVASGMYFYRLETSDDVLTKKMMLLK